MLQNSCMGRWLTVAFVMVGAVLGATLPAPAADTARTVVAGGSVTEIVYAIGADEHLVAVDSTSQYPPAAAEVPNVGYLRQLSAEPMLAMDPTLLLADHDAGPPATLEQLSVAGVEVIVVPAAKSVDAVIEKIRFVAGCSTGPRPVSS
ncbi:MAG: ABC transporter substrate-binding protein [Gammaproteobacteria bacterium]|nr:ABC transporter substrate-binding protein [Gammaproteobacteria bacterium]